MFESRNPERRRSSWFQLPLCLPRTQESHTSARQCAPSHNRHAPRRDQSENMKSELSPNGCPEEVKWTQTARSSRFLEFALTGAASQPCLGESQESNQPHGPHRTTHLLHSPPQIIAPFLPGPQDSTGRLLLSMSNGTQPHHADRRTPGI